MGYAMLHRLSPTNGFSSLSARVDHLAMRAQRGAPSSSGLWQSNTPALFRSPALLGKGLVWRVQVVPNDLTGTIQVTGTIQSTLVYILQ